jgi:hypothetical protein
MSLSWSVLEFEIEQKNSGYPTIDCGVGLDIGVIQHPLYVLGVDPD